MGTGLLPDDQRSQDRAEAYSKAIQQALDDNDVSRAYEKLILEYLSTPDREPSYCCNSGCDPCVTALDRTVERARALLREAEVELPKVTKADSAE